MTTIPPFIEYSRPEDAGFEIDALRARFGPLPERWPRSLDVVPPAWRPLLYLLQRAEIVGEVTRDLQGPGDPPLASFSIFPHPTAFDTDGHIPDRGFARGVARTETEAISKAIGEFLERYALATFRERDFVVSAPIRLAEQRMRFLHPRRLAGFSDEQRRWFPERAFDEHSTFAWVEGRSLTARRSVLLPAQLVYWNYCGTCGEMEEAFLRERNTNGGAGGFSREAALVAALRELIERDAFLLHWLPDQPPPRIDIREPADDGLADLVASARRCGLEVVFLDTTSDVGIPSVVCMTISLDRREPHIVLGGSANPSPVAALRRSLTECLGVRDWVKRHATEPRPLPRDYAPFRPSGIDQASRVAFWSWDRGPKPLRFFGGQNEPLDAFLARGQTFSSSEDELAFITSALAARGPDYEALFFEPEHSVLRLAGYHVVRVVVPALLPLYMNEENAPLGADRLRAGPQSASTPHQPNPWPHPFP